MNKVYLNSKDLEQDKNTLNDFGIFPLIFLKIVSGNEIYKMVLRC